MRVLQVTSRYPPQTGGVETHVAELSAGLREHGHEVTVFAADAGDGGDRRERRDGVDIRRFRALAPGRAFHVAPGVAPAVRRHDADVVHAHNYHSLPLLFAALGAGERPLVATPHYHGASASAVRDRLLSLYRPLGGWALDRADAVVAVSDWERRRLRDDFGVEATVVPNGLHVERFAGAAPRDHGRAYLLSVGRLEAYKGIQHLIRALPELPGYDLLVAGSGDHGDRLREVARETGVADRVTFLGYVPDGELPPLYAGAAAFVTLSSFEAYGMTVAEALAAGTPCVVREAGALGDWVDRPDCVGVADPSPASVARAVEAARGRSAPAADLPTWTDVVGRVEALYEAARRSD